MCHGVDWREITYDLTVPGLAKGYTANARFHRVQLSMPDEKALMYPHGIMDVETLLSYCSPDAFVSILRMMRAGLPATT